MGIQQIGEGGVALEMWACGFRARCTVPACGNLAQLVLVRVARGGAPDGQSEFCFRHARTSVAKAKASGVSVFDNARGRQKALGGISPSCGPGKPAGVKWL